MELERLGMKRAVFSLLATEDRGVEKVTGLKT